MKTNLTSQLGPNDRIHTTKNGTETTNDTPVLVIEKISPPTFDESSSNFAFDAKCKDNCVKDCACVNHCAWGPFH